ncbi:MAG: hypothetical protein ABMA64_16745 [Myxococcota bacterium]
MLGEVVTIEGDRISVPEHASDASGQPLTYQAIKQVVLLPGAHPQAVDIVQTPGAAGWSRVGVVSISKDVMTLSVNFPQQPRPEDLEPGTDGREVVTLERR